MSHLTAGAIARRDMFRTANEAEFNAQPYRLDPDLLCLDECQRCGNKLRYAVRNNRARVDRCEFCHPKSCPKCGGRGEVKQDDRGRGEKGVSIIVSFWQCEKCNHQF